MPGAILTRLNSHLVVKRGGYLPFLVGTGFHRYPAGASAVYTDPGTIAAFSTALLDDFNRTDENPLSQSGNWGGISTSPVNFKLISNQIQGVANTPAMYRTDISGAADVEAYVTLASTPGLPGVGSRVVARLQNPTATSMNCYGVDANVVSGVGNDEILITRGIALTGVTSGTIIGRFGIARDWASGDSYGIRCYGTIIEAWFKPSGGAWTFAGSVSDAALDKGTIGLFANQSSQLFDNFGGGLISVAGPSSITTPSSSEVSAYVDSATVASVTTLTNLDPTIFVEQGPTDFDTTNLASDSNKSINSNSTLLKYGQGFTPSQTAVMYGGSIVATKRGTPVDTLVVELQSGTAGAPSGTVLATVTLDLSGLVAGVETEVPFTFPAGVTLNGATEYFFVTYRNGSTDAVNYWELGFSSATALTQAKQFV